MRKRVKLSHFKGFSPLFLVLMRMWNTLATCISLFLLLRVFFFLRQVLFKWFLYWIACMCALVYVYVHMCTCKAEKGVRYPGDVTQVATQHECWTMNSILLEELQVLLSSSWDNVSYIWCCSQTLYVVKDDIELLLSLSPTSQVSRLQVYSPCSVYVVLGIKCRASCMIGKHSLDWVKPQWIFSSNFYFIMFAVIYTEVFL